MALTLLLLRHAKSGWDSPATTDIDRPLTERGRAAAAETAHAMARAGLAPRRVVCSTARRTRETLAALLPEFPLEMEVTLTRQVYEAAAGDLLDLIQGLDGAASPLLVVGHNPGIEDLANLLVTEGDADARLQLAAKYPTSALAVISLPIASWSQAGTGAGELLAFHLPGRHADD